ncbi:alpha amylase C-terminal domain-containing protein [Kocuria rhizophila]|nr:alpha amylase C-terminal domain-containing protein [Kocuria rhizophila]
MALRDPAAPRCPGTGQVPERRLDRSTPALYSRDNDPSGFEWIDANDAQRNTSSFTRWDDQGNPLACVANFAATRTRGSGGSALGRRVEQVLNTDAEQFGGLGVGNLATRATATEGAYNDKPASAELTVPPLAALFKPAATRPPPEPAPPSTGTPPTSHPGRSLLACAATGRRTRGRHHADRGFVVSRGRV